MTTKWCRDHPTLCHQNLKDNQYLSYFDTAKIPNRRIRKNQNIINKVIIKKPDFKTPQEKSVSDSTSQQPNIQAKPRIAKGKPQPASNTTIPEDVLMKARMANASRIYSTEGADAAQEYLNKYNINYTIETELSSDIGLVLIDNNTGETIIAYRGTDLTNAKDLITDALALFGSEKLSPEYSESQRQIDAVTEMYGLPKELVGFSRGSVLSMNLGDEYKIPTTQLNPLISPSLVENQDKGSFHDIFRTKNDPVSFLAAATKPNTNWRVRSVLPLQDTLNSLKEHNLTQLLTNDTPRRKPVEDLLNERIVKEGAKVSEYTMMKEMLENIEKQSSFTEYMQRVNPADANLNTTTRVYEGSNYTTLWKDMGGSFTPQEATAISRNQVGASRPFQTSQSERKAYANLDPTVRQEIIDTSMENMKNTLETSARFSNEPNSVREELLKQTTLFGTDPKTSQMLVEALNPVSQLKGLAGGVAGFEEAKLIDSLSGGALGNVGVATLGGALGSVNTSLASAALAGTTEALTATALLPEIAAGAAGGIAGYESSIAIAQALKDAGANQDTIQSVSSISGGAIGGATTAAIGVGASVAAAALTGGEIGAVFAPETLGLSVALGAGVGAVIGGASYLGSKVEEAGSTLINEIKNPSVNPYYAGPAPMFGSMNETLAYLNRKSALESQQQQDQAQGITIEQRVSINAGNQP
jgi:hypothetical protein